MWGHTPHTLALFLCKEKDMENTSGLEPVEDKVLLLPDKVSDTAGGYIVKPDFVKYQEQMAQVRALLVATGPNAFENWDEPKPQAGQRVYVCKYAGIDNIQGADGDVYKICTDKDITAIIHSDPERDEFLGTRKPLGRQERE